MSKYVTTQMFGDRRASVRMAVVVCVAKHNDGLGTCLKAGIIVAISSDRDIPYIRIFQVDDSASYAITSLEFVETNTVGDIERLPVGTWTWPMEVL